MPGRLLDFFSSMSRPSMTMGATPRKRWRATHTCTHNMLCSIHCMLYIYIYLYIYTSGDMGAIPESATAPPVSHNIYIYIYIYILCATPSENDSRPRYGAREPAAPKTRPLRRARRGRAAPGGGVQLRRLRGGFDTRVDPGPFADRENDNQRARARARAREPLVPPQAGASGPRKREGEPAGRRGPEIAAAGRRSAEKIST